MKKLALLIGLVIVVTGFFFVFKKTANTPAVAPSKEESRIQVVTSFYPLYFVTTEIVGDRATVYNITPSGAEPHDYEPTTQDIARIEDSELLILNGGDIEPWASDIREILKNSDTKIITTGAELMSLAEIEDGVKINDPHVWLDPMLVIKQAEVILDSLAKADPTNALYYKNNAATLTAKLESLDKEFKQNLNACKKKDIITSHTAFGYLTAAYGFNQVSVTGVSPDEEPSAQQLAKIAEFAKKNNVKYIFFETLVSPKLSETIANEVGAQTLVLNPLEGLNKNEIAAGKNYFTEMKSNLANLMIALECR